MSLGRRGEDVACGFLSGKGHTIVERNYRSGHLEIDIITLDKDGVHFVEVKSRVAPVAVSPEENVTAAKQKKVAVTFDGGGEIVEWFPNAYYPMYL